jgi:uncharacterized OB-fold protein
MSQQSDTIEKYVPEGEDINHVRWAEALRDGVFLGMECDDCGHVAGVPKSVCPDCTGRNLSATELPRTGTVYSETTIEVTPAGQDDIYQVAIVDLGETRVLVRIDGEADIGDEVEFSGHIEYDDMPGPAFS